MISFHLLTCRHESPLAHHLLPMGGRWLASHSARSLFDKNLESAKSGVAERSSTATVGIERRHDQGQRKNAVPLQSIHFVKSWRGQSIGTGVAERVARLRAAVVPAARHVGVPRRNRPCHHARSVAVDRGGAFAFTTCSDDGSLWQAFIKDGSQTDRFGLWRRLSQPRWRL